MYVEKYVLIGVFTCHKKNLFGLFVCFYITVFLFFF